jgi:type I restriction-modification system DNA methylase subunit
MARGNSQTQNNGGLNFVVQRRGDIAVNGQESNYNTGKLARMNLAIRGIDANLGPRNADISRQFASRPENQRKVTVYVRVADDSFSRETTCRLIGGFHNLAPRST